MHDLRCAVRMLAKDGWFTVSCVIALALGIGATTASFTLVNAALLRTLPVKDADRVVHLSTRDVSNREAGVSYLDFEDWRSDAASLSEMAASLDTALIVGTDDRAPERFQGTYISANMFRMLGDTPILGRDFTTEDEAANATPVVILGSAVWKARFGADRALLGRTVRINDVPTVVTGIMPEGFKFPYVTDGWQPLTRLPGLSTQKRDVRTLNVFARLRDGTTINQAQTELATIAGRLTQDHPDTNKNVVPVIVTLSEYMQGGPLRTILLTLMGTVVFVLLIACANIANLMLARAANRAQEITIRISLGATQWRIIQQLLVECVLLTTVASTVGFALAAYAVRLFALGDKEGTLDQQPYWLHWTIDGRVVVFLIMVSFAATLLFGLVPALHIARSNTHAGLKDSGRAAMSTIRASRWTSVLMIIELASTVVLLAGAGLMGRSFLALSRAETVMSTSDVLTMRVTMPIRKYQTADQRKDFFERLENTVRSTPGVASAAVATWLPFGGAETRQLAIFGQPDIPDKPPLVSYVYIGTQYFDTLGLHVVKGRPFTALDGRIGQESAIVNERFASAFFRGENPLGQRIRLMTANSGTFAPTPNGRVDATAPWITIVGISPTVPQNAYQAADPMVYLPYRGEPQPVRSASLIVRAQPGAASVIGPVREQIRHFEPDLPLYFALKMDDFLAATRWPIRAFATIFLMLGAIALILTSVGLYALTAYGVTQRTREIGLRVALGAQARDVVLMFVRRTLMQLAYGLPVGLAGAFVIGKLLQFFLVGTGPSDPVTLLSVIAVLVIITIAACLLPSSRAARIDPATSLRHD